MPQYPETLMKKTLFGMLTLGAAVVAAGCSDGGEDIATASAPNLADPTAAGAGEAAAGVGEAAAGVGEAAAGVATVATAQFQLSAVAPGASGTPDAVAAANQLWTYISVENPYTAWPLMPGTTELQEGMAPHSEVQTIRVSQGDPSIPGDGLIVVKENYTTDNVLDFLTVMTKQAGFDPDGKDWFYARYTTDGTVATNEGGVTFAGAVEPAPGGGCKGCHRTADSLSTADGDFLFMN